MGNNIHPAILHPVIVGRTSSGAKGTSYGVVNAIRKRALIEFDANTVSGLSSDAGLIEMVRDGTPTDEVDEDNDDPGVTDKRLLVVETEYKSVLARSRREGNPLGQVLRQAWDGDTLRTMNRKKNKLTATNPHIVVIGHVTPREFRETLRDSDLSGGSVNRLLLCLSRRSKLHSRFGNVPEDVLARAAALFSAAHDNAQDRGRLDFTEAFWSRWDAVYVDLNRDRPDTAAADAASRGAVMTLRLALIYALIDDADEIDAEHLDAALAVWKYAEHGTRWLFSSHDQEEQREVAGGLASFILEAGKAGRTRTEISGTYFKRNKSAVEINDELAPLIHDGTVVEVKQSGSGTRTITRYVHRSLRINDFTKHAGQGINPVTNITDYVRTKSDGQPPNPGLNSSKCVDSSSHEMGSDLQSSSDSLIRNPEHKTETDPAPPGAPTASTPGMTPAVERALAAARKPGRSDSYPLCIHCGLQVTSKQADSQGRPAHLSCQQVAS